MIGLEIDSVAVRVAKQNVKENGIGYTVRIAQGSLPHHYVLPLSHDIAVANISAKVVSEMASELVSAVRPGGTVIASGILKDNKKGVERALVSAGGILEEAVVEGDWVTLVASIP